MSSCLSGGGGRAYGFDLDIVMKPSSTTPTMSASLSSTSSPRSTNSSPSSPSSTLSESSNSPVAISTKKARTPRKRPNQTYSEAAAMLAKIYPNIFSTSSSSSSNNNHPRRQSTKFSEPKIPRDYLDVEPSSLLPPFPVLADAGFLLLHGPSPLSNEDSTKEAAVSSIAKCCFSPSDYYRDREREASSSTSPPCIIDDDFDADSILDEEVGEGIDTILGCRNSFSTPTVDGDGGSGDATPETPTLNYYADRIDPYLGYHPCSLLYGLNITSALRHTGNGDWWCSPTVEIHDIVSNSNTTAQEHRTTTEPENSNNGHDNNNSKSKNKKKKKVEKLQALKREEANSKSSCEVEEHPSTAAAGPSSCSPKSKTTTGRLKPALSLKLNFEEVMTDWADGGSPFSELPDSSQSPADLIAKLSDIDLFSETAVTSGIREASILRYKEKRRSRLFSKKIRYEVRKANADVRPRMKASGRFVKKDDE